MSRNGNTFIGSTEIFRVVFKYFYIDKSLNLSKGGTVDQ